MKSQDTQWLLREKYGGEKSDAFFADCKRLALGEPLGYLIGHVPFLGAKIYLDNQPLIPRVETEFWVEQAIKVIKESAHLQPNLMGAAALPPRVLDLCAGSGCIGVATASALPDISVDFAELDARLLSTIETNCVENGIAADRYNIYHSNLFAGIPADTTYDFILSNPPYIDPAIDRATESVKTYEPHLALYGGQAGLEIIEQLMSTAADYLKPQGQLWLEHEPEQTAAVATLAHEHGFVAVTYHDQYDTDRYSILVLK